MVKVKNKIKKFIILNINRNGENMFNKFNINMIILTILSYQAYNYSVTYHFDNARFGQDVTFNLDNKQYSVRRGESVCIKKAPTLVKQIKVTEIGGRSVNNIAPHTFRFGGNMLKNKDILITPTTQGLGLSVVTTQDNKPCR